MIKPGKKGSNSSEELIRKQQEEFERFRNEIIQNAHSAKSTLRADEIAPHYISQIQGLTDVLSKMNR